MKKIILIAFVAFTFNLVKSQIKAVTEDGQEVVLFENKSWKFVNDSDEKVLETISTNEQAFEKPKGATFLAKSKRVDAGLYYNPKKWKITNSPSSNNAIEYFFINILNSNVNALFISENAPIQSLKNLKDVILNSVKNRVDYFRLKKSEYRTVNGLKVLYMEYSANAKGLDFEYVGNYFLTNDGYANAISYTFANQYEKEKDEMSQMINGLVKSEKKVQEVLVAPPPPMHAK